MSIEKIIKDLEHTIKYFEGCVDEFQRGRKYQAMRTLEQLRQYNVVGRSEQFTCSCGIPPAIRLCEGVETCLKCGDELSK